jgi:hypothetical protein
MYQWTVVILLSATCLVAPAEPGGSRHHDRQLGFSLELPPRWTVAKSDVFGIARFHAGRCSAAQTPVQTCRELAVVIRGTAEEGETSEAAYRRRTRPWKMISEGRIVVDGETVPWGVLDQGLGGSASDPVMRLFTVVVVRDRRWFEFTGWALAKSFPEAEPTFQQMVRSLAFP